MLFGQVNEWFNKTWFNNNILIVWKAKIKMVLVIDWVVGLSTNWVTGLVISDLMKDWVIDQVNKWLN